MGLKIYCDFCDEKPELDLFNNFIYDLNEDTLDKFGWSKTTSPFSNSVMFFICEKCTTLRQAFDKMPTNFFKAHAEKGVIKQPIDKPKEEEKRPTLEFIDRYKVYSCSAGCPKITLRWKSMATHESTDHRGEFEPRKKGEARPTKYVTEKVYNKLVAKFEKRAGRKYNPEIDDYH